MREMPHLILMRHCQSAWNALNLFTGWVDVPLSKKGIDDAIKAGQDIADLQIDEIHTSLLIRAQMTAMIVVAQNSRGVVPVFKHDSDSGDENQRKMNELAYIHGEPDNVVPVYISWRLNERMYGDLQGQNKSDILSEFGEEQVHIWRRSFDIPPPNGESLELVAGRTIPYLEETIYPALESGKNIFIAAHGNTLRSIIMNLEEMSVEEVKGLEVPIGVPIIFDKINGKYARR